MKKIAETDAIFENVWTANQAADENIQSLRLSIDSKAKVKLSCSRRRSRSYYRQHRLAPGRSLVANLLATEAKQDLVSLLNYKEGCSCD